ncbi:hypothetical protein [Haloarchaeobius iranensis]|uniref:Uncharacterized protein n=1 Tax=Haloarchaeobius iranensis TaxID=996166 RepID=A0A1G9XEH3_9EURY|nr:hypothetical protein [Haloarchaeobius iranensis]SDM94675.1 hypothetical protein SAMN05192554_11056 [Haloarchaeobius iranensis]
MPPEGEGPATFESVVESVRSWANRDSSPDGDPVRRLQEKLERDLNAEAETPWEEDVVALGTQSGGCEIVVNGAIGIRFVTDFNRGRMRRFDHRLPAQSDRYNYLLVYLHELPPRFQDGWRVRQRKFSAPRLGLRDFAFVVRPRTRGDDDVQVDPGTVREVVKTLGFLRMVLLVLLVALVVASAAVSERFELVLLVFGAVGLWFVGVALYLRRVPSK